MDIKQLFVTSINLIQIGEIPFFRLLNKKSLVQFVNKYNFTANPEIQEGSSENPAIVFRHGVYTVGERDVAFPRLHIEPRKIILEVEGSSADTEKIFKSVCKSFALIGDDVAECLEPVLHAEDTIVVSHLDFSAESMLAPLLLSTIKDFIPEHAAYPSASATVRPANVSFEIDYLASDQTLGERRLALSRKEFVLGPQKGRPLNEQIYESKAPLDTDSHIEILRHLEQQLS